MALLRMKLEDERYEIDPDKLTLGEAYRLKREYGMEDFTSFNFFDPEQMIGLFFIAVKRAHPDLSDEEIRAKVEAVESGPIFADLNRQVEKAIEAEKKKANPPSAVAGPGGGQATTRGTRGPRKSAKRSN